MAKVAIVFGVLCGVLGASRVASADGPAAGHPTGANGVPAEAGSEVIEVHGHVPFDLPTPKADVYKIPPYSDELVLGNHWARAWLLLDVDARGVVTRMKFLKRPGYKLDDIAVKFAFGLRFDPVRDDHHCHGSLLLEDDTILAGSAQLRTRSAATRCDMLPVTS